MQLATLVFLVDKQNQKVCLARKKRGFGLNKKNGYGGKVTEGETIQEAAIRELLEETRADELSSGVVVNVEHLQHMAVIEFHFSQKPGTGQLVHVFLAEQWQGNPVESEEMDPAWYDFTEIPYSQMWPDDLLWLPRVLSGEKLIGSFVFGEGDAILSYEIKVITESMLPKLSNHLP
jgi:ADP-ribose pyrophosphatase YjhB (NUDIX family)